MGTFQVEHTLEGDVHYATLTCGRRLVLRIPIPQEQIDEADTVLDGLDAGEAVLLKMIGAGAGSEWALSDAADAVMAVHIGSILTRWAQ